MKEINRNIFAFHNTEGFEDFSVLATAPEGAKKAIFGVRVHKEGAVVQKQTELYLDN